MITFAGSMSRCNASIHSGMAGIRGLGANLARIGASLSGIGASLREHAGMIHWRSTVAKQRALLGIVEEQSQTSSAAASGTKSGFSMDYSMKDMTYDALILGGDALNIWSPNPIVSVSGYAVSTAAGITQEAEMTYSYFKGEGPWHFEYWTRTILSFGGLAPGAIGGIADVLNSNIVWDLGKELWHWAFGDPNE